MNIFCARPTEWPVGSSLFAMAGGQGHRIARQPLAQRLRAQVLLAGLLVLSLLPAVTQARVYVWDTGCQCFVPDYSQPNIPDVKPDEPAAEPLGRCASGPPGLLGNPVGPISAAEFLVSETDPCTISSSPSQCVNAAKLKHRVAVSKSLSSTGKLRRKLVVVLPGSGRNPANVSIWQNSAAYAGYRTIGITYSGSSLDDACPSVERTLNFEEETQYGKCVEQFRSAVLYGGVVPDHGKPNSGQVLDAANSIELRLLDLLNHLSRTDPAGGWDQYLNRSNSGAVQLAYAKIIVAGYSLGSGHAARWATDARFAGVVTLAGPTDSSLRYVPSNDPRKLSVPIVVLAPWIRGSHATPGERRAALVHLGEGQDKLDVLGQVWDRFGLAGKAPLDLTQAWNPKPGRLPWPYEASAARFTVNTATSPACTAHGATAEDNCVALDTDAATKMPRIFPAYMHMFCSVLSPLGGR